MRGHDVYLGNGVHREPKCNRKDKCSGRIRARCGNGKRTGDLFPGIRPHLRRPAWDLERIRRHNRTRIRLPRWNTFRCGKCWRWSTRCHLQIVVSSHSTSFFSSFSLKFHLFQGLTDAFEARAVQDVAHWTFTAEGSVRVDTFTALTDSGHVRAFVQIFVARTTTWSIGAHFLELVCLNHGTRFQRTS